MSPDPRFNSAWRFDAPGDIPAGVLRDFSDLIGRIATQGSNRQAILEHFKSCFANSYGAASGWSSNESWAESDLDSAMRNASDNGPLFIEAFYDGCDTLRARHPEFALPDLARINRILAEHGSGYEIRPPDLVALREALPIAVPERIRSLDEQAAEIIQRSLATSEALLTQGHARPAVQEILWLLETVSTAFKGMETDAGTIQGKYFNKIAGDLKKQHKGKMLEQVLGWVVALHGYLSSPTGGGIRHGTDLREGIAVQVHEARLICNLIRSYITYLMMEHERLSRD
jgi:hypothetical protein